MKIEEGFKQPEQPTEHPFVQDPVLPALVQRLFPDEQKSEVGRALANLGDHLVADVRPLTPLVHAPVLVQYDAWGRRVDELRASEGWKLLKQRAIAAGHMKEAYSRDSGEYSRIRMFMKLMMSAGDYNVVLCPFAMTDGAARVIELYGSPEMKRVLFPCLISDDPERAYLSGQWMTERPGGSDVSQTETVAIPTSRVSSDLGEPYILNGFKWFSSAAEGHMTIALARTGDSALGARSLSAFVIPLRTADFPSPLSNGIRMHRLKNKSGTHGLPTAELELNGTRGWLIGPLNGGIKTISTMLNITRVYSAITSVGALQRALSIARSYATVRTIYSPGIPGAKDALLKDLPIHTATLAKISLLYRALAHLTFGVVQLLGKNEAGTATAGEMGRLRLLTPVIKAWAADKCPEAMMECMCALGGQGYMEEVGIGRLIRDAMVEKIWEGTINVLSLDLLRASKDASAVRSYIQWAELLLSQVPSALDSALSDVKSSLTAYLKALPPMFDAARQDSTLARPVLNFLGCLSASFYLLEHAIWSYTNNRPEKDIDVDAVRRWIMQGELPQSFSEVENSVGNGTSPDAVEKDYQLVYGMAHGKAKAML
ncbi:hypothetical protein PUNSTDRAFT_143321 [Punctularia strigosozonata HHB-11173 SS5]|uniref:uncharacterized protein n=1 Tax=Punctularia strigosozonata (strain HHB-11173) TaxID=741275 RepID=UPI00044167E8|nr:uncharacterized protein PUNSTDRAFT_143321 [Punctularia strigosozonata HHB-11173 SS5]EIN09932.1 hypothetical protein PUNSTDRAFT_143321 [Punctularia strigosozonata HHB-11173 SS5]